MDTADTAKVSFVQGRGEGYFVVQSALWDSVLWGGKGGLPSATFGPLPVISCVGSGWLYGFALVITFAWHGRNNTGRFEAANGAGLLWSITKDAQAHKGA